jgi:hypothetical protein
VHTRPLWLIAALSAAGSAAAVPPPPMIVPDLAYPRTLALGGGVGLATSNEALFLNPAAMASRKRYVADTFYLTDRRSGLPGAGDRQDYFGGSVADSATTRLAAGFNYTRAMKGIETGTLLRLGLATAVTNGLYVGVQGNYFDLQGAEEISSTLNMDAGVFFQVTRLVSLGAAGYNFLQTDHREYLPRGYGAGFAVGSDTSLQLVGDWHLDLDRAKQADGTAKSTNRYALGLEYLYAQAVPIRGGFQIDDTNRTKWWSVGSGFVSPRFAVDVTYRQSTTDPSAKTVALALRVFVPSE